MGEKSKQEDHLSKCKKCNSTNISLKWFYLTGSNRIYYFVQCNHCMEWTEGRRTKERAIQSWNEKNEVVPFSITNKKYKMIYLNKRENEK